MRWINKYHKGFNRLWLVFSIIGAFAFVGFNTLLGEYQVSDPSEQVRYLVAPVTAEEMIEDRVLELWWESQQGDIARSSLGITVKENILLVNEGRGFGNWVMRSLFCLLWRASRLVSLFSA